MKKNLIITLAGLAMASTTLAGCGAAGGGSKGIHVVFWHTFGDKVEAPYIEAANNFKNLIKEKEGVDIEVTVEHFGGYTDVKKVVGTALTGGNGPSMCISYPDSVASLMFMEAYDGQFVRRVDTVFDDPNIGFGKNVYLGDGPKTDFVKSYLEEGAQFAKEGTYVMPLMKSSEIMLYNKTILAKLMPLYKPALTGDAMWEFVDTMTWDDMINLAKLALQYKDVPGYEFTALEYPVFYDSDSNMVITQLEQMGLKYSYKDNNGNPVLALDAAKNQENHDAVVTLLNQYRTWHNEGVLTTKKTVGEYASDSFKNQRCVFCIGSSGGAGYSFPQTSGMDFGVCRVPYRGDEADNPVYISQGPSVCFLNDKGSSAEQNDKVFEYSWKFYKYLSNNVINTTCCVNNSEGYVPVRNSAYTGEIWAEFLAGGSNYALAARVVKEKIGDHFISSLVFNGSAAYRENLGTLVGDLLAHPEKDTETQLNQMVNNTYTEMAK